MTETSSPDPDITLRFVMVGGWAPLAWVAVATEGLDGVTVLHGSAVEVFPTWCAEAVWDGPFADGDLDRTNIVAGTGLRARGMDLYFVNAGDTLSRLHWLRTGPAIFVSNSLPALLATADVSLIDGYDYAKALTSIALGLDSYQREIPSTGGPIHIVYFHNLLLHEGTIVEIAKPPSTADFPDFAAYRDFLFDIARRVGANAKAAARRHSVGLIATLSSGYDSAAVAVLAREAGTRDAVTIPRARRDASNLFSLDDSGAGVAVQLGLRCTTFDAKRTEYPFEDAAWASTGEVGDLHLSVFDHPKPVCLMFTGFKGDQIWALDDRRVTQAGRSPAGTRFSELRLELGVIHCSPVFWGFDRQSRVRRLSQTPEMRPWRIGGTYDRPIPRRLLEEAGVKRGSFATRKRVASLNRRRAQPLSPSLQSDFARFLNDRGFRPGTRIGEQLQLLRNGLNWVLLRRLPKPFRLFEKTASGLPPPTMFLLWANERCRRRYREALASHLRS